MSIRIGILGYGNLGRGVECAIKHNPDLELVAVFTRRAPETVKILTETATVYSVSDAEKMKDKIDVLIICGGSATDLPVQTPEYVKYFNVIDSFDTHAKIPEHFENVNRAAMESGKVGIISVGWDPGMFSLNRLYANAILTNGKDYTFWGKGVSQGHSDAVRRIKGVKDAKQYTIPVEAALEAVRNGENPELTTRQKHIRECFVVAEEGADLNKIEETIKNMPNYFADYDTTVHFISEEELKNFADLKSVLSQFVGKDELSLKVDTGLKLGGKSLVAYVKHPVAYYLSACLIGLGNGHLYPAFLNMFINVARHDQRGTANSSILTGWDLGFGIGCLLGGVVAEHFGYSGTFWMVAIENAASVLLFFAASKQFFEKRRRE